MLVYRRLQKEEVPEIPLFGVLAQKWFNLKKDKLKKSTLKDYRNNLNNFILPKFGDMPIDKSPIDLLDPLKPEKADINPFSNDGPHLPQNDL